MSRTQSCDPERWLMRFPVFGTLYRTKSYFRWVIPNFTSTLGDNIKKKNFRSPGIDCHEQSWALAIAIKRYPNSERDSAVTFYLSNESKHEVVASCFLSIMKNQNEVSYTMMTKKLFKIKDNDLSVWVAEPYPDLANPLLKLLSCVNDEKLTIVFKIKNISMEELYRGLAPPERLKDDLEALLGDEQYSDVTLISSNEERFPAHKCILLQRSSVFAAMFQHNMQEKQSNEVHIIDISSTILREMLRFIYSERVKDIEVIAADLLVAADKYNILDLKEKCEMVLCEDISLDNVLTYFEIAVVCDAPKLLACAADYTFSKFEDIIKMKEYASLVAKHPVVMAEVRSRFENEEDL